MIIPAFKPYRKFANLAHFIKMGETKNPKVMHPKKINNLFSLPSVRKVSLNNIP